LSREGSNYGELEITGVWEKEIYSHCDVLDSDKKKYLEAGSNISYMNSFSPFYPVSKFRCIHIPAMKAQRDKDSMGTIYGFVPS
jgi:hypothetical protein